MVYLLDFVRRIEAVVVSILEELLLPLLRRDVAPHRFWLLNCSLVVDYSLVVENWTYVNHRSTHLLGMGRKNLGLQIASVFLLR